MFLISQIIANIILVSSLLYIWHDMQDKKIDFKNKKLYITLVCLVITSLLNYLFVNKFVKIILITIIFMIFFRYLFKENLQKCIITPIFYQIMIMLTETFYVMILVATIGNDASEIVSTSFGTFITNIGITILSLIISKLGFVKKIYKQLVKFTERIKVNKLLVFSLFIIVLGNILAVATYYEFDFKYVVIINSIIMLVSCIIVLFLFKTQEKYTNVSNKYNVAINSLKEYENMMSKYRVANHENKNLLLTIRAMILNKEKDIPDYINSMIKERYEDDEKLLFETSAIPIGGLKATIYSEILKIKRNNINYKLNIDKQLRTVDIINISDDNIIDICKIIGVFIDNAIDEVKTLKRKNINISLYKESNLFCIKISNNYKNKIEIDKIYEQGYSIKGKDRGYGLALVKKIIDSNDKFENQIEISKTIFSQILSIKI